MKRKHTPPKDDNHKITKAKINNQKQEKKDKSISHIQVLPASEIEKDYIRLSRKFLDGLNIQEKKKYQQTRNLREKYYENKKREK